jgi:hypothetical protein
VTRPVIVSPDAQRATRDVLRTALATREPGATVSTRVPDFRSDDAPSLPYVLVRSDGRFRDARLNLRATVRVSVWHRDEGLTEDLAALCEGLLLAYEGGPAARSFQSVVGPLPAGDPETGDPLSFFTVTARLRPVQLS